MKKKIFFAVVVLGLIAAAYGFYMYNKPVGSLESTKAAYTFTATELLEKFESDEAKANEMFLDKVIAVSGKISKIEETDGKMSIYLDTGSLLSAIICELEAGTTKVDVKEGDKATIKGQCTGYLSDVILVRAVVI